MPSLKDLRQDKGWSVAKASRQAGMSSAKYSMLERGQKLPSDEDLERLSQGFVLSLDVLKDAFRSKDMNEQIAPPVGEVLQIRKIGNSLGLILPKDLLTKLDLSEGDLLHVVRQPDRGMHLTPYDPKHAKAMEIARRAFKTYANTFKALAK